MCLVYFVFINIIFLYIYNRMVNILYYVISVISIWLFIKETNYLHSSFEIQNYVTIITRHIMQRVIKLELLS